MTSLQSKFSIKRLAIACILLMGAAGTFSEAFAVGRDFAKQENGKAKDPASSPPRATATERSPEESLLSGHKVKVTPASLRDFLKSLPGDPVERPDDIQRLIRQLGSDSFAQREAASAKLVALAVAPVKELTAALDHPDAEIARRARMILDRVGQRVPGSALLFASLLVIQDRELNGLTAEVLLVVPLCDSQPLRTAASQAMRATVHRKDRPLLERALTHDNLQVRAIAAAGLAVIDARTEPVRTAPVTWVDFLDTYLVRGQYDGERTDFLKGVPESLAMHFERMTRTANTIAAVIDRHGTSPWLYPVRGKNEIPRALVEAGKKHYPIQGSWRQHWTQWIVLDENGNPIQGAPAQAPHTESCVDFLVVPVSTSRTPRQNQPEAEARKTITLPATIEKVDAGAYVLTARSRVFQYAGMGKSICTQVPDDKVNRTARLLDGTGGVIIVRPTRMEDLSISASAKIKAGGKDIQLTDLKAGDHVNLELTVSEGGLVVVGIERVDAGGEKSGEKPLPKGEDAGVKKEPSAEKQPAQRDAAWDLSPPAKEPKYVKEPRYALLAFGVKREQRVWMVLDGTTLYVDRNGNGNLTEPGERLEPKEEKGGSFAGSGSHSHFDIFEFAVRTGATGTSKFELHHWIRAENFTPKTDFDKQLHAQWLKLRWENCTLRRKEGQGQGQTPLWFMPKPADAQVCALDAPPTFGVRLPEHQVLKRGAVDNDVAFCIAVNGRPPRGVERAFRNPLSTTEVPEAAHLEVEIEYPPRTPKEKPLRRKHLLKQRC